MLIILFFSLLLCYGTQLISNLAPSPVSQSSIPGYSAVTIDPTRVQLLGITTEEIIVRELTKTVRTVGIVEVDETRIANIQTKFNGWIEELYVNFVNMPVQKDQPLFSVYSQDLLATQEEYLLALKDLDQPIKGRFAQEFNRESKKLLYSTRRRLELWDISSEQIDLLKRNKIPTKTLIIRSPFDGIVLHLNAFTGMNVGPGINTYTIADLSHIWIVADIYEDAISFIKLKQPANIELLSLPGKLFEAQVTFIDYVLDASTRTVKVRFELDNIQQQFKPGMYATVSLNLAMGRALAVPEEAIIDTGKRKIVFVSKGKGSFEPREVKLGFKADAFYQLLSGLAKGELVVTSAQFLLDSESRIKALKGGGMKGHGI